MYYLSNKKVLPYKQHFQYNRLPFQRSSIFTSLSFDSFAYMYISYSEKRILSICLLCILYMSHHSPILNLCNKTKPVRLIIRPASPLHFYKLPNLIVELPDNLHMLWIRDNNLINQFLHHCLCQFICLGIFFHHSKCL